MASIDADLLGKLPLTDVTKVTFYKRDELTTDLIRCDVLLGDEVWSFDEELVGCTQYRGHQAIWGTPISGTQTN
jgi:hypothetical protein